MRATGLARSTIGRGLGELRAGQIQDVDRVRRPGGGRKPLSEMDASLLDDLRSLVEPATRGDPQSPLLWTCKSLRKLAASLRGMGHRIGALLLDILFMFGALIVAAMAAEAFGVKRYSQVNTVYSTGATISYLLWVILFLVYQPTCWWAFQGTVGQRLLRLRVVRAADGRSLGAGSTTVRFIIWGLCNVVVVPAIIAAIVAQDEPTQRTWWDDAAGSVVIRQL